jgi:hypothetical protein
MRRGSVTLGDFAGRITILEIASRRCERRGRLRVDRLIAQHDDMRLPELADILAGDCPRAEAVAVGERCSVFFPQLLRLWERTGKSLDEL